MRGCAYHVRFVLDCATSVTQRGKIEVYAREGKDLPSGWVIGRDGKTRTDTDRILADFSTDTAALAPVGGICEETAGYKGYGYATVVEILSSALQAGNFMKALMGIKDGRPCPIELGHFFITINIESFSGLESFKKTSGEIMRQLRASAKAPGHDRIYTAGEKEYEAMLDTARNGVPVPPGVRRDLTTMRNEMGLTLYSFPWD